MLKAQQLQVLHQGHTGEVIVKEALGIGPVQHHDHDHDDSVAKAVLRSRLFPTGVASFKHHVAHIDIYINPNVFQGDTDRLIQIHSVKD